MRQTRRAELGEFYAAHADSAKRLAYRLTGDNELAEDITQDAFVKMAGRLGGLRNRDASAAYLRQTVVNLSRSHFRRKRVEHAYLQHEAGGRQSETLEAGTSSRRMPSGTSFTASRTGSDARWCSATTKTSRSSRRPICWAAPAGLPGKRRETKYSQEEESMREDQDVLEWIRKLMNEEHELLKKEEHEGASEAKRERRREIEECLDQCWDMLRQRRAKRRAGLDPDSAAVREVDMVEHYKQ